MVAPTLYRWDDANAPVARGERASLNEILTACLVTGYGSKAAAGWTREWVDGTNTKAVFRNSPVTGLGMFLRVESVTPANAYDHNLAGYEIMSDIDNGTGNFTPNPLPYSLAPTMRLSNTAGTTARPWVLLADERAFYLICWHQVASSPVPNDASNTTTTMFFGDFVPRLASDAYACGLRGSWTATTAWYNFGSFASPATGDPYQYDIIDMPRPISGASGSPQRGWGVGGLGPVSQYSNGSVSSAFPYSASTGLLLARPYIADRAAAFNFRGFFPGMYQICHQYHATLAQLSTQTLGDDTFLIIRGRSGSGDGWLAFQLTDWWT